jgi:carbon-monoxide dehydrogenase medium subunit
MNDFDWHRATSVDDAVRSVRGASDGRFLAGGQSLLPTMKLGLATPDRLVDLGRIAELSGIERVDAATRPGLRIGATTSHLDVASSPLVCARIPALADLADRIGDPAVRARGTLGGSLANNDPAACYPAAVLALDAVVRTDRRRIAADDFFVGLYRTALEPDELIVDLTFPEPSMAGWAKFAQPASRFSLVGVFASRLADGRTRVAVTGAGACAFRCRELEDALSAEWSTSACERVEVAEAGLTSDLHASARYRAHLIPVLAARAVDRSLSSRAPQ